MAGTKRRRTSSSPGPSAAAAAAPPPPRHRLSVAERDRIIASEDEQLPRALRVPPIRCVSEFVLTQLANESGSIKHNVRAWLESQKNTQLLRDMMRSHISRVGPQWPRSPKTFEDIVRKSLRCYQSTSANRETWLYSLPRTLLKLHELRVAEGFAGLCANDHYSEVEPGRWFQLHLLYRLVMKLQHERARGDETLAGLEPVARADADCPICLKQVEGEGQVWYHLEPCRHWMCSDCGTEYMQARAQSTCTLCLRPVELYVHAASGV